MVVPVIKDLFFLSDHKKSSNITCHKGIWCELAPDDTVLTAFVQDADSKFTNQTKNVHSVVSLVCLR